MASNRFVGKILFLIVGIALTIYGANKYNIRNNPIGDFITVIGVCSRVDEVNDDNDIDYKIYVTYEHGGNTFSNIYFKTVENKSDISNEISFEIDTGDPSAIRPTHNAFATAVIVVGIITTISSFFSIASLFVVSELQNSYFEFYYKKSQISLETIKNELNYGLYLKNKYNLIVGLVLTVLLLITSSIYYFIQGLPTLMHIHIPLVIIYWLLYCVSRFLNKLTYNNIRIVKDEIIDKDTFGIDGESREYWVLNSIKKIYTDSVPLVTQRNTDIKYIKTGTQFYIAMDTVGNAERFFFVDEFELKDSSVE